MPPGFVITQASGGYKKRQAVAKPTLVSLDVLNTIHNAVVRNVNPSVKVHTEIPQNSTPTGYMHS